MEAAVQAATIRLRPILMTSLAFILGVVPLVLATGAGENGRHSVGTTVFGGMIMSTVLNLFFIPVLYLIIEGWRERGKKSAGKRPRAARSSEPLRFGSLDFFLRALRRILAIHSREYIVPRHLGEPQWQGAGASSS